MPVDDASDSSFGWVYIWNAMWCTYITMVTGKKGIVIIYSRLWRSVS